MKDSYIQIFCTTSSRDEAREIARTVIQKKLAACCTIVPNAHSIYSWQGQIEESDEFVLMIKTTQKKYQSLEKEIKMIHSYSVPEIIALPIEKGSQAYLDWISDCTE